MILDDGMDATRRGEHDAQALCQQQPEIALFDLSGRLAECKGEQLAFEGDRDHSIMEDQLDRNGVQDISGQCHLGEVHVIQMIQHRQSAVGILLRGVVQLDNHPVLRGIQAALAFARQFQLPAGELALGQQQIPDFFGAALHGMT
jgi:hypothetical protein